MIKDKVIFLGMNIISQVAQHLTNNEKKITDGMTENELKAYHLGAKNAILTLKMLLEDDEVDYVIHMPNQFCDPHQAEEYTYEELQKIKE